MRKIFLFIGLGALLLTACKNNDKEKLAEDSVKIVQLSQKYNEATSFNDSLLLLMGDIYSGLDEINQQEGLLTTPGVGDNVDKRQEIKDNLEAIKARLASQKQLLAELEQKIAQAQKQPKDDGKENELSKQNSILQKTITDLKNHIANQEKKINELTTLLNAANEKISELTTQVQQKDEQITVVTNQKDSAVNRANQAEAATEVARQETVAAENVANQVYYILGTNKQLKESGVLQKKFLGTTKIMQGENINYSNFIQADKRTLSQIPTNAKKVEIKSNMPKDSYMISGQNDGPKTIVITNPAAFWRNTPYLVVQLDDILK